MSETSADDVTMKQSDLVQLMRFAAVGNAPGTHAALRRFARTYKGIAPAFAQAIVETLREGPLRSAAAGMSVDQPVDSDSRLPLVREENPVVLVNEPILNGETSRALRQIVDEHQNVERLLEAGLAPTRSALLVGPPGVGKTLAARAIARDLSLPLLVLDLSSVMSSFLGRTGVNVRRVLDYARSTPAVLLLDELDAVAKRRDDSTEIGELKRLVTVLLQEIDSWPDGALLLAATNHEELLDPAVWRRFDLILDFPLPDEEALKQGVRAFLDDSDADETTVALVASLYQGESLSRLEREVLRARRMAAMSGGGAIEMLLSLARERFLALPASQRGPAAARLVGVGGLSQRAVHEMTGVSRDTIRKYATSNKTGGPDGH